MILLHLTLADVGVWSLFTQMPPLHPILVNTTAGLIPAAVGFDVLGRLLRRESLTSAGWWALLLAAAVTPFTALAGWVWFDDMSGHGDAMALHKWLGTALAGLVIGLALWRWVERRREMRPGAQPGAGVVYLATAALFVLLLVAQGHLGGMMSFGNIAAEDHHDAPDANAASVDDKDDGWQRGIRVADPVRSAPSDDGHDHAH